MVAKVLLASLTTTRNIDGKDRRVVFQPQNGPVDLTADEMKAYDRLTEKTGKVYYRDPINEGGGKVVVQSPKGSTEAGGAVDDYDGFGVPMESKTAKQLAAFLDHKGIAYAASASKADLLKLAQGEDQSPPGTGQGGGGGSGDLDEGL